MKRLVRWCASVGIAGAVILLGGNSSDLWLWAYIGAFGLVGAVAMVSIDDDLARERFTPPDRGADRLSLRFVRLVALAHILVSVADSRFGWSHVPAPLRAAGLAGFILGFAVIVYAMRVNRYFSAVVRIQSDRGHRVVDAGPYARLRHPGYAAMMVAIPMSGLALGSWYGVAVGVVYSLLILKRVRFEDGFLQQNLEGYRAYAARVRYRLVPGIW